MDSYAWIEHFYRNACQRRALAPEIQGILSPGDLRSLKAIHNTETTLSFGSALVRTAGEISDKGGDRGLTWAVRLFVKEQEEANALITSLLATQGGKPRRPAWPPSLWRLVLNSLPADVQLVLLSCRSAVAGSFLESLGDTTSSPVVKQLSRLIAAEQQAHEHFAHFAVGRFRTRRKALPPVVTQPLRQAVVFTIATRLWIRRRDVFRGAGRSLTGYLSALLQSTVKEEIVAPRPL